ncbi:hypothetical protein EVAR_89195_1 [Eumeta japonica]|uniref:Uncharacterized protein n=1 Tax=Eumeta variegata TaxID=151549 RepID=A0A4C1YGS0_EUMVA|nr:hypothetical protein EVAR_89195_1 [Eumeta japonica]
MSPFSQYQRTSSAGYRIPLNSSTRKSTPVERLAEKKPAHPRRVKFPSLHLLDRSIEILKKRHRSHYFDCTSQLQYITTSGVAGHHDRCHVLVHEFMSIYYALAGWSGNRERRDERTKRKREIEKVRSRSKIPISFKPAVRNFVPIKITNMFTKKYRHFLSAFSRSHLGRLRRRRDRAQPQRGAAAGAAVVGFELCPISRGKVDGDEITYRERLAGPCSGVSRRRRPRRRPVYPRRQYSSAPNSRRPRDSNSSALATATSSNISASSAPAARHPRLLTHSRRDVCAAAPVPSSVNSALAFCNSKTPLST